MRCAWHSRRAASACARPWRRAAAACLASRECASTSRKKTAPKWRATGLKSAARWRRSSTDPASWPDRPTGQGYCFDSAHFRSCCGATSPEAQEASAHSVVLRRDCLAYASPRSQSSARHCCMKSGQIRSGGSVRSHGRASYPAEPVPQYRRKGLRVAADMAKILRQQWRADCEEIYREARRENAKCDQHPGRQSGSGPRGGRR